MLRENKNFVNVQQSQTTVASCSSSSIGYDGSSEESCDDSRIRAYNRELMGKL